MSVPPEKLQTTQATLLMPAEALGRIAAALEAAILRETNGLAIEFGLILRTGRITPWLSNGGRDAMIGLMEDMLREMKKKKAAQAAPTKQENQ